ncbi:MAG TPA: hypothetical protein VGM20_03670 [Gemmatimonadales bacterium]|jgi:hypothetical protein
MLIILLALQQLPAQNFPAIPKPGIIADLGALLDHACPRSGAQNRNALLDAERRVAQPAITGKPSADQWVALGCARARLDADGALAHDGPLMVAGNSWSQGSQRAMIEALKERPTDTRAAEVLSIEALNGDEPDNMRDALAAILSVTQHGTPTAPTLRACAELALRVNNTMAAKSCATRGIATGSDSTWHLLRLARVSFRAADTVNGMKEFQAAANAAHDSAARREVDWHLQWFLTPDERKEWDTVSSGSYGPWVRDRLLSRDVRDGQPFGARIAEHFARLEFVEVNFRLHVAKVMRNSLRTTPAVREDGGPPGEGTADDLNSAPDPGAQPAALWRDYMRWQTDYDDRGVIWMRFGRPDQRVPWSCPITPPPKPKLPHDTVPAKGGGIGCGTSHVVREVWKYTIDGETMLLSFEGEGFDGSVQATRLVTGVVGDYFCDVDPKRCGMTDLARMKLLKPEDVEHIRVQDRQAIATATTFDDNSVRADKTIDMRARLHRLWDPGNGSSIALVTYALDAKDVAIQPNAPTPTASVEMALRTWNPTVDSWTDTAFTRRWNVPDSNIHNPELDGFLVVHSTPGVTSWSLVAAQGTSRRGRAWDVMTPGLAAGPLAISDLVIGTGGETMTWQLRGEPIPLAPDGAVDRKVPMSLYFQIRSDAPRPDLRATVALYRVGGSSRDTLPALQVGFAQQLRAGIDEIAPQIDLSQLDRGDYRIEVLLGDADGHTLVRRSAILQLR